MTDTEYARQFAQMGKCILCGNTVRQGAFCCARKECVEQYHCIYSKNLQRAKNNTRASGKKYENSPERLEEIKNKYKNGVTVEHIKAMLEKQK